MVKDDEIENINDRRNIVLLKLKQSKSAKEKRLLERLTKAYPDNEVFEAKITQNLRERGFIGTTNIDGYRDALGIWRYNNPNAPKENYTTESGVLALKNRLFQSEFTQKTLNERFTKWQLVGILVAAVVGFITIVTFVFKLLNSISN